MQGRLLLAASALLAAALFSGCMSAPPDTPLPWATQQPWEGAPAIPLGVMQQQ
jgi:hypothetical protein